MKCKTELNNRRCNCSYGGCACHAVCCDCLSHHLEKRQLPACYFPSGIEAEYDRSFERFARGIEEGKI